MNFYQLNKIQVALDEAIEANEGEITAEIEEMLEKQEQNKVAVCFDMAGVLEEFKAREKTLKDMKKDINHKLKLCRKAQDNLKDRLVKGMEMMGQKKVKNESGSISLVVRKASKVEILDEEKVPEHFKNYQVELSSDDFKMLEDFGIKPNSVKEKIDKNSIKDFLKGNQNLGIDGIELQDSKSIRIGV
jgi:hypothetical protein